MVDETALIAATIQPTIAYRVNEKWSLGAGLQANYGYMMLQRVQAVGVGAGTKRKQTDSDWAYSGRFGVLYEPSKSTRIGLVYNSQADLNFNVDTAVTVTHPISNVTRTHRLPSGVESTGKKFHIGAARYSSAVRGLNGRLFDVRFSHRAEYLAPFTPPTALLLTGPSDGGSGEEAFIYDRVIPGAWGG